MAFFSLSISQKHKHIQLKIKIKLINRKSSLLFKVLLIIFLSNNESIECFNYKKNASVSIMW